MHIRSEYLTLQEVGGLTINGSMMNHASLVHELKTQQEEVSNSLKQELKANLMQTLQAFSMTEDTKNIDPNLSPYGQSTNNMYHNMIADQEKILAAAIKPRVDPQIKQM